MPINSVTFELLKDVETMFDRLRAHAVRKHLSFVVKQETDMPPLLRGDLPRFQDALTNLISNAIQYTAEGSINVHIGARAVTSEDCIIQVVVSDTGIGMSEQQLDDLFQEFEQVPDEETDPEEQPNMEKPHDPTNMDKGIRMGLGLALLARYVKQCRGQLRGRSVEKEGTTFSLDVPMQIAKKDTRTWLPPTSSGSGLSQEQPHAERAENLPSYRDAGPMQLSNTPIYFPMQSHPGRPQRTGSLASASSLTHRLTSNATNEKGLMQSPPNKLCRDTLRVLIADDNLVNLSILQRRLEKMGHEVKTSLDGQMCVDAFCESYSGVDFILMDINVSTPFPHRAILTTVQMPIVDGIQSTKMIRVVEIEAQTAFPSASSRAESDMSELQQRTAHASLLSPPITDQREPGSAGSTSQDDYFNIPVTPPVSQSVLPGLQPHMPTADPLTRVDSSQLGRRVPIFAVSASLDQHSQDSLQAAGFDGWLSKPINFKRLGKVLEGLSSYEARRQTTCQTGDFVAGGWFV